MNILYLSHLSGASYAGPTYSVPKQIEAQSKIDNVFWYNAMKTEKLEWKNLPYYHDLTEFPEESIYRLPEPFNNPDLIIVECFYNMAKSRFLRELISGKFPYIIIPRGELTFQAQKRKKIKKSIANLLVCKRFARKAVSIQYLTRQEYQDSGIKWNKNAIIIPNGIDIPERKKTSFSENAIKCVSIGRLEPYQKGLDMLIKACDLIKSEFLNKNFSIDLYGPDVDGKRVELEEMIREKGLENIIQIHDPVYGEDKEIVLLEHDVFLVPSRFEGHPMALIEAMAYGLPCVVTEGSNMRQEIEHSKAGWTADNNEMSLAKTLAHMIHNGSTFGLRSQEAIKLANKYHWTSIAEYSRQQHKMLIGED